MKVVNLRFLLSILVVSTFFVVSACKQAEDPVSTVSSTETSSEPVARSGQLEDWDKFVTRQMESYLAVHPQYAVMQGRHEYGGQLSDWTRASIWPWATRLNHLGSIDIQTFRTQVI